MAKDAARRYGSKHEIVWLTQSDFESKFDDYMQSMDQPTLDGLNTYLVADAAAKVGLKVALSGLGGDELFGGYPSFKQLPKIHQLGQILAKTPHLAKILRQASAPLLRRFTSEKFAGLLEYGSTWEGAYMLRRAIRMPWELTKLPDLSPELISSGLNKIMQHRLSDKNLNQLGDSFAIVSYLEATHYMRNQLLRDSDWAGMAHSLEIRLPFLDVPMFQYLTEQRLKGNLLRKPDIHLTANPPLPTAISSRKKTGFEIPIIEWRRTENANTTPQRGLRNWQAEVIENMTSADKSLTQLSNS